MYHYYHNATQDHVGGLSKQIYLPTSSPAARIFKQEGLNVTLIDEARGSRRRMKCCGPVDAGSAPTTPSSCSLRQANGGCGAVTLAPVKPKSFPPKRQSDSLGKDPKAESGCDRTRLRNTNPDHRAAAQSGITPDQVIFVQWAPEILFRALQQGKSMPA